MPRMRLRALAPLALLAAGCGDDNLSGGGGDMASPDLTMVDLAVTADQACADFAQAACGRISACEPWILQFQYGDAATCQARLKLSCTLGANAAGLTDEVATLVACTQAIGALACPDIVVGNTPAACRPMMGTRMNGLACANAGQCTSLYCAQPKGGGCGVCGPAPKAGDSCANLASCGDGLLCADDGTCQPPVAQNGACDGGHPCGAQLTCVGAAKSGTCQPVLAPGANCDNTFVTTARCDFLQGLFCKTAPMSTMGTCAVIGLAKTGEPCGLVNGGATICQAGGHCMLTQMNPPVGTCIAPAADGTACDPQKGPECLTPAVCAGNVCRIPDPAVCG